MPVADVTPSSQVCRSLFGPVDHEQRRVELNKLHSMLDAQTSKRWNFDFKSESPRDGRYTWERVPPNSQDIPKAYELGNLSFTPVSGLSSSTERLSLSAKEDSSLVASSPASSSMSDLSDSECLLPSILDRPSTPVSRKRSREPESRQTLITEYFNMKKRPCKRRKLEL